MDYNTGPLLVILKESVKSLRVAELVACLRFLHLPYYKLCKAEMQQRIFEFLDLQRKVPLSLSFKIKELEKKRLTVKIPPRLNTLLQISKNNESPFFQTVKILQVVPKIKHKISINLEVPLSVKQLFYKKRKSKVAFTYEFQLIFATDDEVWEKEKTSMIIVQVNNEKPLELFRPPPITYITEKMDLKRKTANIVEVEFPFNTEDTYDMTISLVKRINPSQLLRVAPVRKVCRVNELLKMFFKENEDRIRYVSLVCPKQKAIIQHPCRSSHCNHPEVFDLMWFLENMQFYIKWYCPVCQRLITYESLEMEMYFKCYGEQKMAGYKFYCINKPRTPSNPESTEIIVID